MHSHARDHRWAPARMSAYLDDELTPGQRLRLERHTWECAECRHLLHSLRRLLGRLHALPARAADAPDIAAAVRRRLRERRA
jgi:anti-sigma factor RsiW